MMPLGLKLTPPHGEGHKFEHGTRKVKLILRGRLISLAIQDNHSPLVFQISGKTSYSLRCQGEVSKSGNVQDNPRLMACLCKVHLHIVLD